MKTIPVILAICVSLCGCGKSGALDKKNIVAYVNKEPVFDYEVKRDIALRAKYDPAFKISADTERDQLDDIIDRKIVIQSAMEKGLARDERFVSNIRAIWEQMLIRDFIEYKKKELADYLFATDEDIKKFYDNMSYRVVFRFLKSNDKKKLEEIFMKYLETKDASRWHVLGPIGYLEVPSSVFLDAFGMARGEAKMFEGVPNYYIVEVAEKEKAEIAPIENLKPEIEKRVIAVKEKRLFEDWLKSKRKQSKIRVIKEF